MSKSALDKLIALSSDLRKQCPWDSKQTLRSLSPFIIEEAHELVDAVSSENTHKIKEELGDLLYLILLCCQICSDSHGFDIEEVSGTIRKKMVRRHPAVFSPEKSDADTSDHATWYRLKNADGETRQRFADVPPTLPALLRAEKVQYEASALGFDWKDAQGVIKKIEEELDELKRALSGKGDIEHEVGDLLFSIVNLSRFIKVNAELALQSCIQRFCRRFSLVEQELSRRGITIEEASMEEMDSIWDKLK